MGSSLGKSQATEETSIPDHWSQIVSHIAAVHHNYNPQQNYWKHEWVRRGEDVTRASTVPGVLRSPFKALCLY